LSDRRKSYFNYGKNRAWAENAALVMQIGLTMAGSIIFCFFVGLYLDRWLGTRGVLLILFILFGIVGGAVTVYRQIGDMLKDKHSERNNHGDC
jgi:F0F1-type ATP synthase assembly protein I